MSKKTYYIIVGAWFALVALIIGATFIPSIDESTKEQIKNYLGVIVFTGAIALILIRRKVKNDD